MVSPAAMDVTVGKPCVEIVEGPAADGGRGGIALADPVVVLIVGAVVGVGQVIIAEVHRRGSRIVDLDVFLLIAEGADLRQQQLGRPVAARIGGHGPGRGEIGRSGRVGGRNGLGVGRGAPPGDNRAFGLCGQGRGPVLGPDLGAAHPLGSSAVDGVIEDDLFHLVLIHHGDRQGHGLTGDRSGGVKTAGREDGRGRESGIGRGRFMTDNHGKGRGQVFTGLVVTTDAIAPGDNFVAFIGIHTAQCAAEVRTGRRGGFLGSRGGIGEIGVAANPDTGLVDANRVTGTPDEIVQILNEVRRPVPGVENQAGRRVGQGRHVTGSAQTRVDGTGEGFPHLGHAVGSGPILEKFEVRIATIGRHVFGAPVDGDGNAATGGQGVTGREPRVERARGSATRIARSRIQQGDVVIVGRRSCRAVGEIDVIHGHIRGGGIDDLNEGAAVGGDRSLGLDQDFTDDQVICRGGNSRQGEHTQGQQRQGQPPGNPG